MGTAKTFLLLIFASIFCNVYAAKEVKEIVVQVPDLGYIKGRVSTKMSCNFQSLKFNFSKKATKFETIFHLIWRLLSDCQIFVAFSECPNFTWFLPLFIVVFISKSSHNLQILIIKSLYFGKIPIFANKIDCFELFASHSFTNSN